MTRVFYGSTEAGPGTQLADADLLRKPGSVGLPQPGVDVRLVDAGEVCCAAASSWTATSTTPRRPPTRSRDGWYHTGDLGALDDDGYLSIVGRARDVIRTGGETVAPAEVEACSASTRRSPRSRWSACPIAQWGEVVTRRGRGAARAPPPPTSTGLRAFCDGRLAGFKQPRRVAVVDALPRTAATGQIQRTLIVERLQTGA